MPKFIYEWRVALRHERQGFGRTKTVLAMTYVEAVECARRLAASDRYTANEFEVVELVRGRISEVLSEKEA